VVDKDTEEREQQNQGDAADAENDDKEKRVSVVFITNYGHGGHLYRPGKRVNGMPLSLAKELRERGVVKAAN
jgi:hypothetical protein